MRDGRPFSTRYGEALFLAGIIALLFGWISGKEFPFMLAGGVAAIIGGLLLWRGKR